MDAALFQYCVEDSADSSDDEMLLLYANYMQRSRIDRVFRDRSDPLQEYSDEEFRIRFRLDKQCVIDLFDSVRDNDFLNPSNRLGVVSPMNRLLIALRFYASGSFQVISFISIFTLYYMLP